MLCVLCLNLFQFSGSKNWGSTTTKMATLTDPCSKRLSKKLTIFIFKKDVLMLCLFSHVSQDAGNSELIIPYLTVIVHY